MKVVLFSVLILVAFVQTASRRAKHSSRVFKAENRRETGKYFGELNIGDPFLGKMRYNGKFRELSLPTARRRINRWGNRRKRKFHLKGIPIRRRDAALHGRADRILNFCSPRQLQEYLFSEAENANHILRTSDSWHEQVTIFTTEFTTISPDPFTNIFEDTDITTEFTDFDSLAMTFRTRKPFRQRLRPLGEGDWYLKRRRRPSSNTATHLHSLPWSRMRNPYYLKYVQERINSRILQRPPSTESIAGENYYRLKQMMDDLDTFSEERKDAASANLRFDFEQEEKDRETNETITDIKDKIDSVIIPLLTKILHDVNVTSTSPLPLPPMPPLTTTPKRLPETTEIEWKRPANPKDEILKENILREILEGKDRDKPREKEIEAKISETRVKHNFPCKIDGLWLCTADSIHLNITTMPNMTLRVNVIAEDPNKNSFINKDWSINGITLATAGGPFLLAGVCPEKRKVANFIGQCRSCREEDVIFGMWTYSTAGKDCTEVITSFSTKIDVFKRERGQLPKLSKMSQKK